ncbi:MAG: hypothetical protein DRQ78_07090 [Epsilonproteobacteria bacterium]|nr:MAG: hypothetical protein DRQ78_07090 [Campylobacterota bacterium]
MTHKRILIVEDELLAATYLKKILTQLKYNVISIAKSADEAIRMVKLHTPDIILMDISLEGEKDGCEAAMYIQKKHTVKLYFLTAHSDEDTLERAIRCKPDGYILKPYNINQIKVILALEDTTMQTKVTEVNIYFVDNYSYRQDMKRLFLNESIEVAVGPKALCLIALLCKTPNVSISNIQIMQEVYQKEVPIQTLRSLVHRIRQNTSTSLIKNVNGLGYKICSE